jgi:hypothetical protein
LRRANNALAMITTRSRTTWTTNAAFCSLVPPQVAVRAAFRQGVTIRK